MSRKLLILATLVQPRIVTDEDTGEPVTIEVEHNRRKMKVLLHENTIIEPNTTITVDDTLAEELLRLKVAREYENVLDDAEEEI